jgi:hypothetical protein
MTLTNLGGGSAGLEIGAVVPGVFDALFAAQADLEARIAAMADFSATVGLDVSAQIELAASISANLTAALDVGITASLDVSAQVALMVAAMAELQLLLQVILDLFGLFAVAGVYAYHYAGPVNALGGEVTAELASGVPGGAGSDACNALVFIATAGATWTAMQGVFKVAP